MLTWGLGGTVVGRKLFLHFQVQIIILFLVFEDLQVLLPSLPPSGIVTGPENC